MVPVGDSCFPLTLLLLRTRWATVGARRALAPRGGWRRVAGAVAPLADNMMNLYMG